MLATVMANGLLSRTDRRPWELDDFLPEHLRAQPGTRRMNRGDLRSAIAYLKAAYS